MLGSYIKLFLAALGIILSFLICLSLGIYTLYLSLDPTSHFLSRVALACIGSIFMACSWTVGVIIYHETRTSKKGVKL